MHRSSSPRSLDDPRIIVYAQAERGQGSRQLTYASHFGLSESPFSITPDPRFLYMSTRHREALAHLLYGVTGGGGFVQLTGEVGTGKTTICRYLLEQLPPDVDIALILNPKLTALELLASVCDELRIAYPTGTTSLKVLVDALYHHLLGAHARARRTVLVIDEAQNLTVEVLEQIRLLTNLETTREKLLQIILIGQPELSQMLERAELRQLAQRVTARYHLLPFSPAETRGYILHRMEVGGQRRIAFTEAAMREVHRLSGGVPRLINVDLRPGPPRGLRARSDAHRASHPAHGRQRGPGAHRPATLPHAGRVGRRGARGRRAGRCRLGDAGRAGRIGPRRATPAHRGRAGRRVTRRPDRPRRGASGRRRGAGLAADPRRRPQSAAAGRDSRRCLAARRQAVGIHDALCALGDPLRRQGRPGVRDGAP